MDPELMAKLSRRLRAVEGSPVQAARDLPVSEADSGHPARAVPSKICQWPSRQTSSENEHEGTYGSNSRLPRRRVQVPAWIVDTDSPRNACNGSNGSSRIGNLHASQGHKPWSFQMMAVGTGTSSSSSARPNSSALSSSTLNTKGDVEAQLRARLAHAEKERDTAQKRAEDAEASANFWSEELASEALKLRRAWSSLRGDHDLASSQACDLRRLSNVSPRKESHENSGKLAVVQSEIHDLGVELYDLGQDKAALMARCTSLQTELERQDQDCSDLQRKLKACRSIEAELEAELEAAMQTAGERHPQDAAEQGGGSRLCLAPPSRSASNAHRKAVLPPAEHLYDLHGPSAERCRLSSDDSTEDPGFVTSSSPARPETDDIEFAYDWGLELAGRMSVERALQLAHWAATAAGNMQAAPSSSGPHQLITGEGFNEASGEDLFEVPLAELKDALAVLTEASVARSAMPNEGQNRETHAADRSSEQDLSAFEAPMLSLQQVLKKLQPGSEQEPCEESDQAQQRATVGLPTGKQQLLDSDFDAPIAGLQQAIAKLGQTMPQHTTKV